MRHLSYFIIFSAFFFVSATSNAMESNSDIQSRVNLLIQKIGNRTVSKIEVIQIPSSVLTRTRITPIMLEKQFNTKLIIRDIRGDAHEEGLIGAVKSISAQPQSEMMDIRWGISFYDIEEKLILSIYFDKSGKYGAVGDTAVNFNGRLFNWLDKYFSICFQ